MIQPEAPLKRRGMLVGSPAADGSDDAVQNARATLRSADETLNKLDAVVGGAAGEAARLEAHSAAGGLRVGVLLRH